MIDIPFIPPSGATPITPNPSVTPPITSSANTSTPNLNGIETVLRGTVVDALVTRFDAGRVPVVQLTNQQGQSVGELPIASQLPLTVGSQLQLRILENTLANQPFTQQALNQQSATQLTTQQLLQQAAQPQPNNLQNQPINQQIQTPATPQPPAVIPGSTASSLIPITSNLPAASQIPPAIATTTPTFNFTAEAVSLNGRPLAVVPTSAVQVTIGEDNTPDSPSRNDPNLLRVTLARPGNTGGQPTTHGATPVPEDNVTNSNNGTIRAVVVTPSTDASAVLSRLQTQSPLPAGTAPTTLAASDRLSFRIVNVQPAAVPADQPALTQTPTAGQAVSRIPAAYQEAGAQLRSGATIPLDLTIGTPFAGAVSSAATLSAQVLGAEGAETVVQTPLGTLKLQGVDNLPPGSQLTLQLTGIETAATEENSPLFLSDAKLGTKQLMLAGESPLQDALDFLQSSSPELARMLIAQLPQMSRDSTTRTRENNQHAAAKLLWFVSSLQTGSASSWMGTDNAKQLQQHSPETMQRLDQAFAQMRALSAEPNQAGWYNYLMPAYDEERLTYVQAWVKREGGRKKRSGEKDDVRFMVSVTLDQLGDFQLDGFVHKTLSGKTEKASRTTSIDLIIRTHEELPAEMQSDIYTLFGDSLAQTGSEGRVQFQSGDIFPSPAEAPPEPGAEESIVV